MLAEISGRSTASAVGGAVSAGNEYAEDSLAACAPNGLWREWRFVSLALRYYVDESESQSEADPAVTVAGYAGNGKKWMQFFNPWNAALDLAPKRVDVFHARDYAKGHSSKWGTYHGWTDVEREEFIDRLVRLIRRDYKFFDVGCGFALETASASKSRLTEGLPAGLAIYGTPFLLTA